MRLGDCSLKPTAFDHPARWQVPDDRWQIPDDRWQMPDDSVRVSDAMCHLSFAICLLHKVAPSFAIGASRVHAEFPSATIRRLRDEPRERGKPGPSDLRIARRGWSPCAFSDRPVAAEDLRSLFEAARWSASSYNEQPWRSSWRPVRTRRNSSDCFLAWWRATGPGPGRLPCLRGLREQ